MTAESSVGGRRAHVADPGRDGCDRAHRYTRQVRVLFVCTANLCRSPMAAALFAREVEGRADGVEIGSAGLLPGGVAVPPEVVEVMATYGVDLSSHRSRSLTSELLTDAQLVVGMGRRHVREAVLLEPEAWPRAFTLKGLIPRGRTVGPRAPADGIDTWVAALHEGRSRAELAHRSSVDEVADPYGGPLAGYRAVATELESLSSELAALLWPDGSQGADRAEA